MDQSREDSLSSVDFDAVAGTLRDALRMIEAEGASRGEKAYYDPKFLGALYPFLNAPSEETAGPLLKVAPFVAQHFQSKSASGDFRSFKDHAVIKSSMSKGPEPNATNRFPAPNQSMSAFHDSARPDAQAPRGWWIVPILGLTISLALTKISETLGGLGVVLMAWLLVIGFVRARRNRSAVNR